MANSRIINCTSADITIPTQTTEEVEGFIHQVTADGKLVAIPHKHKTIVTHDNLVIPASSLPRQNASAFVVGGASAAGHTGYVVVDEAQLRGLLANTAYKGCMAAQLLRVEKADAEEKPGYRHCAPDFDR